ncbi:N-acetyl-gamma-glutamyl-phosphate reductase [Nanchangia anserum]|uniref:N-acetyl-gamma-glutamyl-phosphate reductase n=1 Tax=Nanchangia anserum TaxID=2692125 RepID=A0A8I0KN66_9ACTO|nr:N-acetyl-gamma-glutamyl-phosphate reductase [Nanchangia anserum]
MTYRAAVVGASGYAGGEILRHLVAHPDIDPQMMCAATSVGRRVGEFHPHLPQVADRVLVEADPAKLAEMDVVFLALPHGASGEITAQIEEAGGTGVLIDCGADHRLTDAGEWERYYGSPHAGAWDYGMPELLHAGESAAQAARRTLATSRRIAVPGCNVTAVTLGIQPAVAAGLVDATALSATLAVGYSGAGKAMKPHLMASVALGSAQPYAVGGTHRHIPEIIQNLRIAGADDVAVTFTPVLVPFSRGILATIVAPLSEGVDEAALERAYACYDEESLIDVLPRGTWPTTGDVTGSGRCTLNYAIDSRAGTLVVVCAIDNLGKGTASAAVQSANIALGLPEYVGISIEGVAP